MGRFDEILAITLSGVRSGEAPEVIALIKACGLITDDITDEMLRNFLVARKGDQIVGVIGLEIVGTDALLRSLAVSEQFRNQGVARMLMEAIQRYALSQRLGMLFLLTLTAETFFIERGFEPTPRDHTPAGIRGTQEFKRLCPDTAVCLRKRLDRRA